MRYQYVGRQGNVLVQPRETLQEWFALRRMVNRARGIPCSLWQYTKAWLQRPPLLCLVAYEYRVELLPQYTQQLVGMAWVSQQHELSVTVERVWRLQRVGQALVRSVMAEYRRLDRPYLYVRLPGDQSGVIRFYHQCGFKTMILTEKQALLAWSSKWKQQ